MIYTVTFNPSLDYIVSIDSFQMGKTNRTTNELMLPGGKGLYPENSCAHLHNSLLLAQKFGSSHTVFRPGRGCSGLWGGGRVTQKGKSRIIFYGGACQRGGPAQNTKKNSPPKREGG